jgi:phospholipid:diacylglycerol acyltransferase
MAVQTKGAVRHRGRQMEANDPADADDTIGGDPKLGASAPSKGKHKGTKSGKGRRVPSATKYLPESRPWVSVRVDVMKRIALILLVTAGVVYLRSIPTQYIPEAFQDRVEHAMPHWLNSSMHLLNGLPALNTTQFGNTRREIPSPGAMAKQVGRTPHHPVVIIPGFVSSGLELWEGLDCGRHFFRQRMWGTPAMARAYFTDRACWMQHMRLDPVTGLDPAGIKLRAVTGLEAVDWFVPGYFVWGKVIESLGDVGYDPNSIHAATFDWRLSPEQLEKRDGYFTRLKASIETLHNIHKEKVAL